MRRIVIGLAIVLSLGMLSVAIVLMKAIDEAPRVVAEHTFSYQDVARLKQLFTENDPRQLSTAVERKIDLTQRDVNLLADYWLSRKPQMAARMALHEGSADVLASISIPRNAFGEYLNISSTWLSDSEMPELIAAKIGEIAVPSWFLPWLKDWLHQATLEKYPFFQTVLSATNQVQVAKQKLQIVYQWDPQLFAGMVSHSQKTHFSSAEKLRLAIYNEHLAELSRGFNRRRGEPLHNVLRQMFAFAQQRSHSGEDPIQENRALLLVMGAYVTGTDMRQFLSEDRKRRARPYRNKLLLHERFDLAQHFIISAVVTLSAGAGFADALGIFKELDDSQGGSGFSFVDLLADQAGVRFGELAVMSPKSAGRLQIAMANAENESIFMPKIDNLPEGLQKVAFTENFVNMQSEQYQLVDSEIKRRIATCSLYEEE